MLITNSRQMAAFKQAVISEYLLEEAIAWISQNLTPEQVFGRDELVEWAEDNGYVVKE